jgi:hypothetical protein
MSGVATTVEENRALKLSFEDSAFSVVVGFAIDAVEVERESFISSTSTRSRFSGDCSRR